MHYPEQLSKLIDVLKRFPGVGTKTAERFAFEMLNWPVGKLKEMGDVISHIREKLKDCPECGCLIDDTCSFCTPIRAEKGVICIVASPRDAYSIEQTHEYQGLYHVLGGVLSPMDGIGPDSLHLAKLYERISNLKTQEVVIALDSTLDGDATALYIKQQLESLPVRVSRLAFGLPIGSSLDYVDGGTLARALTGRGSF